TNPSYTPTTGGIYAVWVTQNGCTELSGAIQVTLTGLADNTALPLEVFPNPTSDMLHVNVPSVLKGTAYSVYDGLGNLMLTGNIDNEHLSLNVQNLPRGIYMLYAGKRARQVFVVERK